MQKRRNPREANKPKLPVDRRDFMRLFSAGAMSSHRLLLVLDDQLKKLFLTWISRIDQILGVPTYYATTVDGAGVVVKTREGRPVFIEGNFIHSESGNRISLAMSELQALYHPDRRKAPLIRYGVNREGKVAGTKFLKN